jgi:RHS repeat-associated protein
MFSHCVYGYNIRNELVSATKNSEYTEYQYQYDDIGNRETSSERGTNSVYTANNLNQYTAVDDFTPQFDDDGNQTLIKTDSGIWQVHYNGENRPILWQCVSTNSITPNSSIPTLISMSYNRMGRRVTKNNQRFVYNGYLQIANFELQTSNNKLQTFVWDPSEPVATRPLVWSRNGALSFYTHDGNKNVSEVVCANGMVDSHYDYAPFGALTQAMGECAFNNPWRFSCEYVDDDTFLIYYNYRHYNPVDGCWLARDLIEEDGGLCLYAFCCNNVSLIDNLGLDCLDNLSNFAAGVGDSLSFGLSKALRKGISKLFFDDWSDPADTGSKEYVYGEVTETVVEIAITLGGATLRHVAKHTARGAIEGGARQAYRRRHNLIGKGGFVHHVNPIKGHPNGKGAMFPLPFRWAARTDLNMKWYATKAEHLAAHKRLMFEDDLERFRILTTLPRATINACVQHLNNEVGEGCWDSLEVNGAVNIYDSNVNVNAAPESISFSLIEGAW